MPSSRRLASHDDAAPTPEALAVTMHQRGKRRTGTQPAGGAARGRNECVMGEEAIDIVRAALLEALLIAGPILGAGLVVGLFISLFQAVTQIQEQTLTFVPKIIVMIIVAVVLLSWISGRLIDFAHEMFTGLMT